MVGIMEIEYAMSTSAVYIISWGNASNDKSAKCIILGRTGGGTKTFTGNETSCYFTVTQIASVGADSGLLQVAPYQVESGDFNKKEYTG